MWTDLLQDSLQKGDSLIPHYFLLLYSLQYFSTSWQVVNYDVAVSKENVKVTHCVRGRSGMYGPVPADNWIISINHRD